jgi:NADPH-dependent 2,4-dienoyl-CoA reductase/sulfur reductase-like enzyme
MQVRIVGGVAGGASCAARLYRRDERAGIVMVGGRRERAELTGVNALRLLSSPAAPAAPVVG